MQTEIILVLFVLTFTVFLFVTEILRGDVVALLTLLLLGWLKLISPAQAFSGLASNAVVSIIGVMIMGYGIDRSGVMKRITAPVVRLAGSSEKRMTAVICVSVGLISGFMQNIGATALFLPAVMRISRKIEVNASRFLMPMGFSAIQGGTLTLVGSGPLIILNDLLKQGKQAPYSLFSVTPVGLALLASGILYFLIFGKHILPRRKSGRVEPSVQQRLIETWQLPSTIYSCRIPEGSGLIAKTCEEAALWSQYGLNLLAMGEAAEVTYSPWRFTRFAAGQELALLGEKSRFDSFVNAYGLEPVASSPFLSELRSSRQMGFAELIVPPRSPLIGKSIRQIAFRKNFAVEPVMLITGQEEERGDFSDVPLRSGNILLVYGAWPRIVELGDRKKFVRITPDNSIDLEKHKPVTAVLCFLGAIGLVIAGMPLALSLISGAMGMVIFKVISIDEAYRAVDWRTVFLLAGLIPLGIAMNNTGAAAWIAGGMMDLLQGSHPIWIFAGVAALTTVFSLFMSNVAATVLLVPLVLIIGNTAAVNPRALALLVAVCAANSFLLPTHQVNALLLSPGGYHNRDYLKAGSMMTVIFLFIAVTMVYFFY
ncbi:MAG: anion permease [Syntrophaceae bacterium]|nr:anion permease [Syntrophaceae bacterium]